MFLIDPMSRTPIYEQLTSQVEKLILVGVLQPGQQLPSVRSLSFELSINPNTVQKAYTDLCARELLCSVPGKGCFVAKEALSVLQGQNAQKLQNFSDTVREMKLAGVSKETLLKLLDDIYS